MPDIVSNRILGAIRFVDAVTGIRVARPLRVSEGKLRLLRNRSGDYAIFGAEHEKLAAHRDVFSQPPADPATAESVEFQLSVADPGGEFMPRSFSVKLPRKSDPTLATDEDSLFQPVKIKLYPASTRSVDRNWCAIRVSVTRSGSPVGGLGVRVVRADAPALSYLNTTGANGEALIVIAEMPFLFVEQVQDNAEVVNTKTTGTLELFLHEDGVAVTPDMMQTNDNKVKRVGNAATVDLAAGTSVHKAFTLNP